MLQRAAEYKLNGHFQPLLLLPSLSSPSLSSSFPSYSPSSSPSSLLLPFSSLSYHFPVASKGAHLVAPLMI